MREGRVANQTAPPVPKNPPAPCASPLCQRGDGTGIAPRDTTFEAIQGLLEKEISGFGELFRMLSYQDIGSAAMLTRATAGVAKGKVVVSLPGSTGAVELGMTKLLLPELGHMLFLLRGERHAH